MKEILLPILGIKKAFVYQLDFGEDQFYKTINRHEDKLFCQHFYFEHYLKTASALLSVPINIHSEQLIGKNVSIHPTADVHHTAVIGPNVSIGAKAKIRAGCRIQHAIILEDSEVQDNSMIICALVGWNSKVGPWCRLEGSMIAELQGMETEKHN